MDRCRSRGSIENRISFWTGSGHARGRFRGPILVLTVAAAIQAQTGPEGPAAVVDDAAAAPTETVASEPAPLDANAEIERELQELQARPHGLTAVAAAKRAVEVSLSITARRHQEQAADSEIDAARIRYAPRLTLAASYNRLSPIDAPSLGNVVVAPDATPYEVNPNPVVAAPFSFPVLLNQTMFRASVVVPLTDYFLRFPQLLDAAAGGKDAAHYDVLAERARTATQAKMTYYLWAGAVLQQVTARQAHERATHHLEDTKRLLSAGLATPADVRAVQAQEAQAELLETRASNAAALRAEQLRVQLRLPPNSALSIGEQIVAVPPLPAVPPIERAWAEAEQARPELLALVHTEHQLRRQADATSAGELPRLDALGEVLTANPNPRYQPPVNDFKTTWAVGVQATWTVNDWPSNAATVRGLEARASAVAAQRDALREALRNEIVSASRGVSQAQSTIKAAERGVRAAESAYQVRKDLYLAGRATNVELTDAETELTRARIDYIDALVEARIAVVQLDHALGRDVRRARSGSDFS